jgi:hypothetical protein
MKREEIDNWITDNYTELNKILAKFCMKYKKGGWEGELFSLTYLHVIREDLNIIDTHSLSNIFKNFAYYQCKWSTNTYLMKEMGDKLLNIIPEYTSYYDIQDDNQDLDNKLKEHKDYMDKIGSIEIYRQTIHKHNDIESVGKQKLFKLYFNEGCNVDSKLAKRLDCSRDTAARMIRQFRKEIKDIYTSGNTL